MIGFHTNKKNINNFSDKYNAFQIFTTNPRSSYKSTISNSEMNKYNLFNKQNNIYLVGHFRYTFNLGQIDKKEIINVASNDIDIIYNMGGCGCVFHTGNFLKLSVQQSEDNMYNNIINIIDNTSTNGKFILETSAGEGTSICTSLDSLANFYNRFNDNYKKRIKICIDTCHIFASGYDISTIKGLFDFFLKFHQKIGWQHLELFHLNDSKTICNSKKDRHENLESGFIWNHNNDSLIALIQIAKITNIPIILETPDIKNNNFINIDKIIQYSKLNINKNVTNFINKIS
jgi:deoxyribonuclease-4